MNTPTFSASDNVVSSHAHTEVALPLCAACLKPITFYMHQDYSKTTGMVYFHPECCPTCTRDRAAAPA